MKDFSQKHHTKRHYLLHLALDELVADWIGHNKDGNFFTQSITLKDFIRWSATQAKEASPLLNTEGTDISAIWHGKLLKPSKYKNYKLSLFNLKCHAKEFHQ